MTLHYEVVSLHSNSAACCQPTTQTTTGVMSDSKNDCHQQQQQQQQQLVYEPQSNATPVKQSANSSCSSGEPGAEQAIVHGRRKRRSLFGNHKQSPVPKVKRKSTAERRACLTEILWEDVQKAKEFLGFRQSCQKKLLAPQRSADSETVTVPATTDADDEAGALPVQQHPVIARLLHTNDSAPNLSYNLGPLRHCSLSRSQCGGYAQTIFEDVENVNPAAASTRRPRRHRRASSDHLDDKCISSVPSTPVPQTPTSTTSGCVTPAVEHQNRISRFWELRRIIRDLLERKADKARQLAALETAEKQLACETETSTTTSELCFPTQFLVAVSDNRIEETHRSELLQLQEEVSVQKAVVEANGRLLKECQSEKNARLLKRRRAQEYHRSQEKLRQLYLRIAELRTLESNSDSTAAANADDQLTSASSLLPIDDSWSQSLPSLAGDIDGVSSSTCPLASSTFGRAATTAAAAAAVVAMAATATPMSLPAMEQQRSAMIGHARSVDSGFQEISCTSSTTSLDTTASLNQFHFN